MHIMQIPSFTPGSQLSPCSLLFVQCFPASIPLGSLLLPGYQMSGSSNPSSNALQWPGLRLRPRRPQTAGDGRTKGPSIQARRALDPDSAFEVNSGLQVGGPTWKLANPETGGKVFGLRYALPIGGFSANVALLLAWLSTP